MGYELDFSFIISFITTNITADTIIILICRWGMEAKDG